MQGLASMDTKDAEKHVLDDRKRRRLSLAAEMKALGKYKKKLKARLKEGDWPIDARTGEKAEIDHDDVMAPLPDDMKAPIGEVDEKMQALRAEADQHQAFSGVIVPIDDGILSRRRREREDELADRRKVHGPAWTEDLVEARVEEAFRTLFRATAGGIGPREFGNGMPTPIRQMADLVAQAGNKSLRRAAGRLLRDRGPPSNDEVTRMNDTLLWASRYLINEPEDLGRFINLNGFWKAADARITKKCEALGIKRQQFYRDKKSAVQKIMAGLIRDGRAPT